MWTFLGWYLLFLISVYAALSFRVLPRPMMKIWFGMILILNMLLTGVFTLLADRLRLVGVKRTTTQVLCTYICCVTFHQVVFWNPQIQITLEASDLRWSDIPMPSAVVLNHSSLFDAFLFVAVAPLTYIWNVKTLMKDSLREIPIFGGVFDRIGHFPVYFNSDKDGDFSVNKEKQAAVAQRVDEHIQRKGRLALFPEGVVNKNPVTLSMFRLGTFSTIITHKLPLYYILTVGNHETWPRGSTMGGLPANIHLFVKKFEVDFLKDDAKAIADRLQAEMQVELDRINDLKGKKYA